MIWRLTKLVESGLYKIKFRDVGIRVVYALKQKDLLMTVVVVSVRVDNKVYETATKRRKKHNI